MIELYKRLARRLLKLPEGNPAIPAGKPESVKVWNPAEGYLRYRLLGFSLVAVPMLLFAVGCLAGAVLLPAELAKEGGDAAEAAWIVRLALPAAAVVVFLVTAFQYAVVHLELDMLRYTLTDRAMRLRRGVTSVEEVTLSYANIQNVKFRQGPVQRLFGIADLIVETAGGGGMVQPQQGGAGAHLHHQGLIKGVGDPQALKDMILSRVRAAKGAGLGDARDQRPKKKPKGVGSVDTPEGRALLREIRDALAAIRAG